MIAYQQSDSAATFTGAGLTGQSANAGGTVDRLCSGSAVSAVNTRG